MKKILLGFLVSICCGAGISAQSGKYAGSLKKLIDTTYDDERNISRLKNWQYLEGSVMYMNDDGGMVTLSVYKNGTIHAVLFSEKPDSGAIHFTVMDVLEIKNVARGWEVKTTTCRDNKNTDVRIVTVAKTVNAEIIRTIQRAWRLNPDKRRIEVIPVKGIDCVNEGLSR